MFCTNCGTQLPDTARFCPRCGTKVEAPSVPVPPKTVLPTGPAHDAFDAVPVHTADAVSVPEKPAAPAENTVFSASAASELPQTAPEHSADSLRQIYIIDFMARMAGDKENLPLFIYLILNVLIIGVLASAFFSLNWGMGLLVGLLLYILSMTVALSPIGEALLRLRTECKPIKDEAIANRLNPIFAEVYAKAKAMNPSIPDNIKLYMNDDHAPNAFATGRRTVCVTRGLLSMTDEEIRATLGHEFGHLAHKDTDRILVVTIGNTFITAICVIAQVFAIIGEWIGHFASIFMGEDGVLVRLISSVSRFLTIVLITAFMKVWTALGVALCMKTSRGNEYQADAFSCKLGYGEGLISMLSRLGGSSAPEGLFASLAASHPATEDRIARLRSQLAQPTNF